MPGIPTWSAQFAFCKCQLYTGYGCSIGWTSSPTRGSRHGRPFKATTGTQDYLFCPFPDNPDF